MNQNKMRKSEKVMLSGLGVMALIVVSLVVVARITVSTMDVDTSKKAADVKQIDYGDVVERNFDIRDFDSIKFLGTWKVKLERGDKWQVELRYPRDMEDQLQVKLENGRLILDPGQWNNHQWTWNWNWWKGGHKNTLRARIIMPDLKSLDISGATDLDFNGFEGDHLNISISGAGNVEGRDGRYRDLDLNMSGAGNVDMRDVIFVDARVNMSGAGNVNLGMDGGILSGNLSGFGNIEYYGSVSDEHVNVSGFGKVHRHH